jgi:hypothetical protein
VGEFLDFVGLAVFIVLIIILAAAVTAAVVRISPTRDKPKKASQPS